MYSPAVGMASWSGVIDSGKAWENYTRHNKERVREKTRDRDTKMSRRESGIEKQIENTVRPHKITEGKTANQSRQPTVSI